MEPAAEAPEQHEAPFPSLPARLIQVFFSPGKLMESLAEKPAWGGALLAMVAVIGLMTWLTPVDLTMEMQREFMLDRGFDFPEQTPEQLEMGRYFGLAGAVVGTALITFVFAGLYTLLFAFILGDEGTFKKYLAALSHSWFIAALLGLVLLPLRVMQEDLQLTLNLSTFMFFLPEGYFRGVLQALDLTHIWSTLVFAQGAHTIDPRRSFGSAAAVGMFVLLVYALIAGRFLF